MLLQARTLHGSPKNEAARRLAAWEGMRLPDACMRSLAAGWAAVKDLKSSYHNGDQQYGF